MKKSLSKLFYILLICLILIIGLSIVLITLKKEILGEALYTIIMEIDKALILTIIIGTIAKMISNDIYKVKKNDDKMRKIGIYQIGEGKLDNKQANIMFGSNGYEYPLELKFLFISGDNFTLSFKERMKEAIKQGCNIKYLIADPIESKEYLERSEELCPQSEGHYYEQVYRTLEIIKEIQQETKDYKGSIEVRHYKDEYRYNYRLAIYKQDDNETIRLWANFQPQDKDAIDLSLGVHGIFDEKYVEGNTYRSDKESSSIVLSMNRSFDMIWKKYENTSNVYLNSKN